MKPTIKELWCSGLVGKTRSAQLEQELSEIKKEKVRLMRTLVLKLDDEGYRALMDRVELDTKQLSLCCEEAFEKGFSLGVKLIAEALDQNGNDQVRK